MKARQLNKRSDNPTRYEASENWPKYWAFCKPNMILNGYVEVTDGVLKAGDYFQNQAQSIEGRWVQAIGAVGNPIKASFRVCRPKAKVN